MATTGSAWAALHGEYNYRCGKPGVRDAEALRIETLKRRDRRNNPTGRIRVSREKVAESMR